MRLPQQILRSSIGHLVKGPKERPRSQPRVLMSFAFLVDSVEYKQYSSRRSLVVQDNSEKHKQKNSSRRIVIVVILCYQAPHASLHAAGVGQDGHAASSIACACRKRREDTPLRKPCASDPPGASHCRCALLDPQHRQYGSPFRNTPLAPMKASNVLPGSANELPKRPH